MRLLNVETMKMEEFFDEMVPPYAILSHRWSGEEVSLQEWHRVEALEDKIFSITREPAFGRARYPNDYLHDSLQKKYGRFATEKGTITSKSGYSKIISCCKLVRSQGVYVETQDHPCRYVWIDTCCIDKTNNAELSEAINSMFRWYQKSVVCLVHLADVHTNLGRKEIEDVFRNSTWFQRGWTLQELLASPVIKFFDQEWKYLFDRQRQARLLSNITRIDEEILTGSKKLSDACSAEKMSWAASRTTTRKEDMAYCLLGIFDVNMPLLYGEGDKAFVRLQEEIIRQSGDLSIFAWGYNVPWVYETCGIFAHSPVDFIGCSELRRRYNRLAVMSMTNVTLSVQLRYYKPRSAAGIPFVYADLDCSVAGGMSILLPLVIEEPEGSYHASNFTPSDADITALRFERRGGSRPIVLSEVQGFYLHWFADDRWVPESGTLSILKKNSGYSFVRQVYLGGLNVSDSQSIMVEASSPGAMDERPLQVVLDEVYPPQFSGKDAKILEMAEIPRIGRRDLRYPVSAEGTLKHLEHGNVSYLRISCWNGNSKRSEMVVIVRSSETNDSDSSDSETTMEVRLSEWPHHDCESLADCAFRGHLHDEHMGVTPILGQGVEGKRFGNFIVEHTTDSISFSAPGEANGKSGKLTERSEGRNEEGMVEEAEDRSVEEVGSDGSENSDDLGVHGLFDHSRNATTMTQTGASNNDTGDTENDSSGNQVNEEGDVKIEEDSDHLGITGLFRQQLSFIQSQNYRFQDRKNYMKCLK
jgi:hypothetical protein